MQKSSIQFSVKCINQNDASTLCVNSQCKHPSLMCDVHGCQCKQIHDLCPASSTLTKLNKVFQVKGRSYHCILNEIYNWYWNQSKLINVEMEELKILIDEQKLFFEGNEKKLYQYLVEGKSQLVISSLVADVIASISKEPQHNVNNKLQETKKELVKQENSIKQVLRNIKNLYKITNPIANALSIQKNNLMDTFKFEKQFCSSSITVINNHTIKLDAPTNRFNTALLTPPLKQSKLTTFTLKINKAASNQFMFGVCQLPSSFNVSTGIDLYDKIQYGAFRYYDCKWYLGKSKGHNPQDQNYIYYGTGDVIEIEYDNNEKQVTIRNITINSSSVACIAVEEDKPIYVAMIMYVKDDEIQLIKVEQKE